LAVDHDAYAAHYTTDILRHVKSIALVGASQNAARPSYGVMQFLLRKGYDVVPINPGLAGQEILGQKVYASLAELPKPVDMIDIFRNSEAAAAVVDEALALGTLPKIIWMQLGVRHDDAAHKAEAAGLNVVMNRCPAIELNHI
jgi:uncharacterized protein